MTVTKNKLVNMEAAIEETVHNLTETLSQATDFMYPDLDLENQVHDVMITKCVEIAGAIDTALDLMFPPSSLDEYMGRVLRRVEMDRKQEEPAKKKLKLWFLEQKVWDTLDKLENLVIQASEVHLDGNEDAQATVCDKLVDVRSEVEDSADILFPQKGIHPVK